MVAYQCPVEVRLGDVGWVLQLVANAITWAIAVLWPLVRYCTLQNEGTRVLPKQEVALTEKKALKRAVSADTLEEISKELDAHASCKLV